jgi:hypothetical protein
MSRFSCIPQKVDIYGERSEDDEARGMFLQALEHSYSTGIIHDCLEIGKGLPRGSVMLWKVMEFLPFRRMDLRKDGTWKAIRW